MGNGKQTQPDDLQASANLKRIDELQSFKKDYEGKEFDKKVLLSIQESRDIEKEIKKISWLAMREKITWFILGGLGVIFIDLLLRVIPNILKAITG